LLPVGLGEGVCVGVSVPVGEPVRVALEVIESVRVLEAEGMAEKVFTAVLLEEEEGREDIAALPVAVPPAPIAVAEAMRVAPREEDRRGVEEALALPEGEPEVQVLALGVLLARGECEAVEDMLGEAPKEALGLVEPVPPPSVLEGEREAVPATEGVAPRVRLLEALPLRLLLRVPEREVEAVTAKEDAALLDAELRGEREAV
jgi:hypothetical protein